MNRVEAVLGDIVTQPVDAVVNAASNAMRGGGGVDGAIHRAAGPSLLGECIERFPHGLRTGDAGWTGAGDLPARWVIHTVGPNYAAGQRDRALLTSAYVRSLQVADELGAFSVTFPLISAGVYGWPLGDAIELAVDALRRTPTSVERIALIALDRGVHDRIRAALAERPPTIGALFAPAPQQWGGRGDTYLWRRLGHLLSDELLPGTPAQVRDRVMTEFERMVGATPSPDAGWIYVADLDPGHGMSAGQVDLTWWYETGLPLLMHRADRGDDDRRFTPPPATPHPH